MNSDSDPRGFRSLTPAQLLSWAENIHQPMRFRGFRDLLPTGHLAARLPVMVDWSISDMSGEDRKVVLRNVNSGGNPLDRTTVLHSVRLPLDRIADAELIMVPTDGGGSMSIVQHGQLRFIFEAGHGPEFLTLGDAASGVYAQCDDLVLSWEVWRYRDDGYTIQRSLNEANPLTMRAYSGPQRYLEDVLLDQEWIAYRLRMPGGRAGLAELLGVALSLGDGIARRMMAQMVDEAEETWLANAPPGAQHEPRRHEQWEKLRGLAAPSMQPEEVSAALGDSSTQYHPLVRSCVGLVRHSILLAANRLVARGQADGVVPDKLPVPMMGDAEPWMHELANSDLRGIFLSAPLAFNFLVSHPEVIPARIPEELAAAGLLAHRDSKLDVTHYAPKKTRPYGADGVRRHAP